MSKNKFKKIDSKVDFIQLEHEILSKWDQDKTFDALWEKNNGNKSYQSTKYNSIMYDKIKVIIFYN